MRKAKTATTPTTVTLRQIEEASPCWSEYAAFLKDLKCNPVTDEFIGAAADRPADLPRRKTPAYGPDDPIKLIDILDMKQKKASQHYSAIDRVAWLLRSVPELQVTSIAIEDLETELLSQAGASAMRKVLGG